MIFQRRRLQVLLSVLVIVISLVYLGGELGRGPALAQDGDPPLNLDESQLATAYVLLRDTYVHKLDETPLLEGAVAALRAEAGRRGLPVERLPAWAPLPKRPGQAGLVRVESYLDRVASLDPRRFPRQEAIYTALSGMTETLSDPYTVAMDPATFARFNGGLHTRVYGGIGMEIEWTHGAYVVFEVLPGGPAALARIEPGDVLLAVDGKPLASQAGETVSLEQARMMLAGQVGGKLTLKLMRGGAPYQRTLTRTTFESRSVSWRVLGDPTRGQALVGWLRVESLGETTGREMAEAVKATRATKVDGYVIDLRDNVGGYLDAAVEVASSFLPSGQVVVYVEGRSGHEAKHTIGADPVSAPLVVLVNGRTASSAEILAGALQDHKRAFVLGSRTFGKGSVQTLHDFADGGGFKMTTAHDLTPNKRSVEGRGLAPDVAVQVGQSRDEAELQAEVLQICHELWTTTATKR
jgi:carboxyl-terminal processing protease